MCAFDTTYTFTATDTITSAKMNNIIDQTTITTDAIIGTTLDVASGKLKIRSQGITSNELATDAVTSTKITAGVITPDKLSAGGPQWGGDATNLGPGVSGTYYFQLSPTRSGDGSVVMNLGAAAGNNSNASITRYSGANGELHISQSGAANIVFNNPGGTTVFSGPNGINIYKDSSNNANFPVPNGTAPLYAARAFINFNGTGTIASRWSGNVSSIVDNGTGNYTINFATHMPDASFTALVTSGRDSSNNDMCQTIVLPSSGASVQVLLSQTDTGTQRDDSNVVCVAVFR